jgi:hypothetical protein
MPGPITTYQILKDTTEHAVIKLTGSWSDYVQEDNAARIAANTLYGALDSSKANLLSSSANTGPLSFYGLNLHRLWYDTVNAATGDVELYWTADTSQTLMMISGNCEYDGAGNWVTIPNAAKGAAGCNGNIGIRTRGMTPNTSYTIVIEVRKDNSTYQRGQFNDPAAFNYGQYSMKP